MGLTGGIGSGKSTVAAMLQALGARVIDADALSRASTAPGGEAIAAIAQAFGSEFITTGGALDRDRMRERVFHDSAAKHQLEAIIHPIVRAQTAAQLQAMHGGCAVLDLPLLAESPTSREGLDTIWVVDCSPETQVQRVMQRNGWSREQVQAVLRAQATREQRLALAHTVIHNEHQTLEQLQTQVALAYCQMCQKFGL